MKLWIDDVRPAPEGYKWVKSSNEAYRLVNTYSLLYDNEEVLIDLDHNAGKYAKNGGDYIYILNYIEQLCLHRDWRNYIKDKFTFHIHSMNPVGRENMRRIIQKNGWKEV